MPPLHLLEGLRELLRTRVAIDWTALQAAFDHAQQIVRDVGAPIANRLWWLSQDPTQHCQRIFALERQRSRQKLVTDDAERPDVAGKPHRRGLADLLGRHVRDRTERAILGGESSVTHALVDR